MNEEVPVSDQPSQDATDEPESGLVVEVDPPANQSAAAGSAAPSDDRAAGLEAALGKSEQERKDNWDKYVRAVADLENHRRRTKRDLDDAKAEARTKVLKEMLPVIDNLERAVQHGTGDGDAVLEGVRLVLRQFTTALERCEVTAVEAEGKAFDPTLHEAIGQQESDQPAGTVISVLQKGYKLADRLLRPSLVVVARPRAAAPGSADGGAASGEPS
jgi:molecular chaperone GrpE